MGHCRSTCCSSPSLVGARHHARYNSPGDQRERKAARLAVWISPPFVHATYAQRLIGAQCQVSRTAHWMRRCACRSVGLGDARDLEKGVVSGPTQAKVRTSSDELKPRAEVSSRASATRHRSSTPREFDLRRGFMGSTPVRQAPVNYPPRPALLAVVVLLLPLAPQSLFRPLKPRYFGSAILFRETISSSYQVYAIGKTCLVSLFVIRGSS